MFAKLKKSDIEFRRGSDGVDREIIVLRTDYLTRTPRVGFKQKNSAHAI